MFRLIYPLTLHLIRITCAAILITLASSSSAHAQAGWSQIPNTTLRSVCPPNGFGGSSYNFLDKCTSVTAAWNSAVFDSKRNRLVVWGGGHADYLGNEIYALDLTASSIVRLTDPALPVASSGTCPEALANDTQANSRHTYDGIAYMENADRMFVFGGSKSYCGYLSNQTWTFDFSTSQWQNMNPSGDIPAANPGIVTAYDSTSGKIFLHDNTYLYAYAFSNNSFQRLSGWNAINYHMTATIDPIRKKFVIVGAGKVYIYDISPGSSFDRQTLSTTGGDAIVNSNYPGLAYDPRTGHIVAWNGGDTVYSLDIDTAVWKATTYSGGPGAAPVNGTYKRWSYAPTLQAFVLVNNMTSDAYLLRLASDTIAITSFTLTSPQTRTLAPFALGHAFKQGDIPSGSTIVASIPNFQASIKTRWPDGSVQFAILAGRANLQANTPLTVSLSAGTGNNNTALTETDLAALGANAEINFSGIGSVQLSNLIGQSGAYDASLGRWGAGKVLDWVQGPEMSSWIYSAPIGSDPSLSAWFEVRLWQDGSVEILPWLENGYLLKSGADQKTGIASIAISGVSRFSQSITILHHTRTVLAMGANFSYWLGATPQVIAKPNTAYLQQSRLVPTYGVSTPSSSALFSRLAASYTPFAQANYETNMMDSGYQSAIGIIPEWDAAFLTSSGDSRALTAVMVNAYAAGRYGIHYRNEKTNRPFRFSDVPNLVLNEMNSGVSQVGGSTTKSYTPSTAGGTPPIWDSPHHPSVGFMAYLLSGRFYFMEESQFAATVNFLKQSDKIRKFTQGIFETAAGANTTRGAAWALRSLVQALVATPDNDPIKPELQNSLDSNVSYYHSRYLSQSNNPQGVAHPYTDYTSGDNVYMHSIWMEDFLTASFGYMLDVKAPSAAMTSTAAALFSWKAQSIIKRLGPSGVNSEYDFRDAAQYTVAVAPSDSADWSTGSGPWYANWGQIYSVTLGTNAGTAPANTLRGENFPYATSYWGNLQPAIAYAVTLNVAGAAQAYNRMTGASNWSQFISSGQDNPVWMVVPSTTGSPDPSPTSLPNAPGNLAIN